LLELANHKITGPAIRNELESAKPIDEGKTVTVCQFDKLKLRQNGEIKQLNGNFISPVLMGWKIVYESNTDVNLKNDGDEKSFSGKELLRMNSMTLTYCLEKVQVVQTKNYLICSYK